MAENKNDRKAFNEALVEYLGNWAAEVAVPAARMADELYEDRSFRYLLMKWKENVDDRERTKTLHLRGIVEHNIMPDEDGLIIDMLDGDFRSQAAFEQSQMMRDIIKDVYGIGRK